MIKTISSAVQVLLSPEKALKEDRSFKTSRFLLFACIYLCFLGSSLMSLKIQQTETFKEITYNVSIQALEKQMAAATEEEKEYAREGLREQLNSQVNRIIQLVGTLFTSGFLLLRVLILWGVMNLMARFIGGEESPFEEKKHRRTFYLSLYSTLPVVLSYIISGVMLITKNPNSYAHIITMEEYILAMDVSPSLYYLFRPSSYNPGPFLGYFFTVLTNPLMWWHYFVLFAGIKTLLHLNGKKAVAIITTTMLVFAGFSVLAMLPSRLVSG